ncbi:MAG: hypothetical protein C4B59_13095 [Candidatus Methanogaster sp.]|uniref:Uncharacterized protein n=1 Tax=Candidatus Methanogaster sp. TaxID=3386292 RepID=A0AC61KZW2_9EURY|nr:MAG: hypothetical protein C4B59_13095 [ANME-2 cluster archaeon]
MIDLWAFLRQPSPPADAAIALAIAASDAHDDAADVSRDRRITSLDALMILQAAADTIELARVVPVSGYN